MQKKKHPKDAPKEQMVAVTATLNTPSAASQAASTFVSSSSEVMSVPEKDMLCIIQQEAEPLNYPLHPLKMAHGPDELEYEIPDEAREAVLAKLYPFMPCPKLTDRRLDIHEQKEFVVKEFRVIRGRNRNFLVSPFYPKSGGMVVDWMPIDQEVSAQYCSNK